MSEQHDDSDDDEHLDEHGDAHGDVLTVEPVEETDEDTDHTIEEGETLESIATDYGILHTDVIARHEGNAELFKSPLFKAQQEEHVSSYEDKERDETDDDGEGNNESDEDAHEPDDEFHPAMPLPVGEVLKIPPRKQTLECETGKVHVFKLRPVMALPAISRDASKRMAMELALKAYLSVEADHTKSKTSWAKHKLSGVWRYGKMRTGASVGVSAAAALTGIIIVAATTNPLSLGAMLAVAGTSYAIKKIIDYCIQHAHEAELRTYYKRKLFDDEGKQLKVDEHLSWFRKKWDKVGSDEERDRLAEELEEINSSDVVTEKGDARRKEILKKIAKVDENFAIAVSADAETVLRKAVVHMRKARSLLEEDFSDDDVTGQAASKIDLLLQHDGAFGSCEYMIAQAKYGMKFIHEVDKFKNYLLPAINHLVFFIDAYGEYMEEWLRVRDGYEKPILEFMRQGNHAHCMSRGKILWKTEEGHERMCMRSATDPKKRAEIWDGYVGARTGLAVSFDELDEESEDPQKAFVAICMRRVRHRLVAIAKEMQESIVVNKAWSAAYFPDVVAGYSSGIARYSIFKKDMLERYDDPGIWKKSSHKVQNYNMAKSKAEKGADVLTEGLQIGALVGGACIGDAFTAPIEGASGMWNEFALKVAKTASKKGTQVASKAIVFGYTKATKAGKGLGYEAKSHLLPITKERFEFAQEEALKDDDGKQYKEGAIQLEQVFKKIQRHYLNAHEVLETLKSDLEETLTNEEGQLELPPTCGAVYSYATRLYEFHHEFDKMERYLISLLSFVGDLICHAKELSDKEEALIDFFGRETGGTGYESSDEESPEEKEKPTTPDAVKLWIRDNKNHNDCPHSTFSKDVCYGPPKTGRSDYPRHRMSNGAQIDCSVALKPFEGPTVTGKTAKCKVVTDRKLTKIVENRAKVKLTCEPADLVTVAEHTVSLWQDKEVEFEFVKEGQGTIKIEALAHCFVKSDEAERAFTVNVAELQVESVGGQDFGGGGIVFEYKTGKSVSVKVTLDPPLKKKIPFKLTCDPADLLAKSEYTLSMSKNNSFSLKTGKKAGEGKLTVTATEGGASPKEGVEIDFRVL